MSALEPTQATMRGWLAAAERLVSDHIAGLEVSPASGPIGASGQELADALSVPIGEAPLSGGIDRALEIVASAAKLALSTTHPGYLAYVPGGGIYAAAVADYIADGLNRFTGLAGAAPGFARLESDVLGFFKAEFGYGPQAAGLLTTGGSMANFSAVVAARDALLAGDGDFRRALVYTSSQAHRSVVKAVRLAGIPPGNVRLVPVDGRLRMQVRALADMVVADRAGGAEPFLVVAAAGTTNTGAIDPLAELALLARRQRLWLHVDGAYGGAFVLTDEGRRKLDGIQASDSVAFDPHKGMFLPYGTGCLLVADGQRLRQAHADSAAYLQDLDHSVASPADLGPELSRDFRGLRVWLPLMLHGAGAFRRALVEKLELTRRFTQGLRGLPLEVPYESQLTAVAFRLPRASGETLRAWSTRNAELLSRINARQRVHLSSTMLPVEDGEVFTPRMCVLSFRTHAQHMDRCLADVAASLGE